MTTYTLNKLSNLQQRLIAGILGSAFIIFSIYISEWGFFAIFLFLCFSCQFEFYKLVSSVSKPNFGFGILIGLFNFCLIFAMFLRSADPSYLLLNFPLLSLLFVSQLYEKLENPFTNISFTLLGIVYTAIPFALFVLCAFSKGKYSYEIVIGILLMLWASDTGAYAAGRIMGKTKLFERISPKKTWEGFFGGLFLSLVFAYGLSVYFDDLHAHDWFILSIIIVVAGVYGDLVESMLKRSIKIKDSGSFIPGHGGFLDRFDSLLLAIPFMTVYLLLFSKL